MTDIDIDRVEKIGLVILRGGNVCACVDIYMHDGTHEWFRYIKNA